MNKADLLHWLQTEYQQWQAFLEEIGPERMEQPGVAAHWSVKDIIAHLTGWHHDHILLLEAALHGQPEPPPPWPEELEGDDEINAWMYETYRQRPLPDILDESHQLFQRLLAVVAGLPDDIAIEPEWRVVRLGEKKFAMGQFFDHFHDDHEPDMRAWLARA